jgi:hypothetical protein
VPRNIMQDMEVLSASAYHRITRVPVFLSPDPLEGHVYKCGSAKVGDNWVNLFTPTKVGLEMLMHAAGIEELHAHAERTAERIWYSKWTGEYEQPDGKRVPLSGEKEIDLRVHGTRWDKKRQDEWDALVGKRGVAAGRFTTKWGRFFIAGTSNRTKVSEGDLLDVFFGLDEEVMERVNRTADDKATRFVQQSAQFGLELAETGARLRAVRSIMQIGQYTAEQLKDGFIVVRAMWDMDRMSADLGREGMLALMTAQFSKSMGLELSEGFITGLISAPEPEPPEESRENGVPETVEGMFEEIEEATEVEGEDPQDEDVPMPEEMLFEMPIQKETIEFIERHYGAAKFPNVGGMLGYIFDKTGLKVKKLTEGEGLLVWEFITRVSELGDVSKKELADAKADFKGIVKKCLAEKRTWATAEVGEQIPLPGVDDGGE